MLRSFKTDNECMRASWRSSSVISEFISLRRFMMRGTAIAQAYFYFSQELSAATAAPFILIVVARRQSRKAAWYYLALLCIFRALHIDAHGRANKCAFNCKKKLLRSEKQLLQIATVRRYLYIWCAVMRSSIFYPDR